MTYEKIFDSVKKAYLKADKNKLSGNFAFQFNITGKGEGIFYVAFRDGALEVAPYDYVDRNAVLIAAGDVFIKLAGGKLTLEEAVSSGQISVEGDYDLALSLNMLATSDKVEKKEPVKKNDKDVKKAPVAKSKPTTAVACTADDGVLSIGAQSGIKIVSDKKDFV